jgi:RsiW-degrading membrane proteinase PrsW (M82 family)
MPSFAQKLSALSRDRSALIRSSIWILCIFFFVGLLTKSLTQDRDTYWLLMTTVSLAGLVWFVIIAKLGGIQRILELRMLYAGVAVGLGILSAQTTLSVIDWQKSLGILPKPNGEFLNDIIFWISGVGLREETVKMLFIIPLIPFVLRRRNEAEMLLISSCVGLGFAIEENINYLHMNISATMGRMLMANFAHLAWTGALGLALFRFIRWPKTRCEEFIGTFIFVVVTHGLYDAFFAIPELADYGIIGFVLFCVIANRHFDLIQQSRENITHNISPLGVFIIGCTILVGLSWLVACVQFGWQDGLQASGGGALSVATLAFLYINRLRSE